MATISPRPAKKAVSVWGLTKMLRLPCRQIEKVGLAAVFLVAACSSNSTTLTAAKDPSDQSHSVHGVQATPAHVLVAGAQAQRASNYDARVDYNQSFAPASGLLQQPAIQELRGQAPGVAATYDKATGVTRSLLRRGGYLTEMRSAAGGLSVAKDFIAKHYAHLGLTAKDLGDYGAYQVTDEVYSSLSSGFKYFTKCKYICIIE